MPIYEYRCLHCKKRSTILLLKPEQPIQCKYCQSASLERLMSRFSAPKSEEARLEFLADPSKFADLDENDPKSMARMMKKMGREMGEDFDGDFDQMMEEGDGNSAGNDMGFEK